MNMHMPKAAVSVATERTAEHVGIGHPDKATDQMSDGGVDAILDSANAVAGDDEASPDHPADDAPAFELPAPMIALPGDGLSLNSSV